MTGPARPLDFFRRDLPHRFERWRLGLAPGAERATEPGEWAGALVLVERGLVEVVCRAGGAGTFREGDLLALGWLPLRTLRNPGAVTARLVAVRRRDRIPTEEFLHVVRSAPLDYTATDSGGTPADPVLREFFS